MDTDKTRAYLLAEGLQFKAYPLNGDDRIICLLMYNAASKNIIRDSKKFPSIKKVEENTVDCVISVLNNAQVIAATQSLRDTMVIEGVTLREAFHAIQELPHSSFDDAKEILNSLIEVITVAITYNADKEGDLYLERLMKTMLYIFVAALNEVGKVSNTQQFLEGVGVTFNEKRAHFR